MKGILLLVLLLVMPLEVMAADFLDSFAEYNYQVRRKLGVDTAGTGYHSDTTGKQFVREAVVFVVPLVRAIKSNGVIVTTYRTHAYALDTLVVDVVSAMWIKNDSIKTLLYKPKELWYQGEDNSTTDGRGFTKRPSYYDYDDDSVYFYPAPTNTTGDTISISMSSKVKNISAAASLTDIPPKYRIAVLYHALFNAAASRQHPHTAIYYQEYITAVNSLRSKQGGGAAVANTP